MQSLSTRPTCFLKCLHLSGRSEIQDWLEKTLPTAELEQPHQTGFTLLDFDFLKCVNNNSSNQFGISVLLKTYGSCFHELYGPMLCVFFTFAAMLQKCFVDCETSHQHLGLADSNLIFSFFWVNLSFKDVFKGVTSHTQSQLFPLYWPTD